MGYTVEELGEKIDGIKDEMKEHQHHKQSNKNGDSTMEAMLAALVSALGNKGMDTAGLMALANQNKGDLPAFMAACQNKDNGGFGGGGMGILIILLFFLMMNNGTFGGARNAAAAEAACGSDNCQRIIGLHDRISAAQAASTQGFFQLDTKLCSSIAETIAAVRNQGDRNYDATRNVGDAVRDCCCKLESVLSTVLCEIKGLSRDVRDSAALTQKTIELEALKQENARQAMECRIIQHQKDCCCDMERRFDKLDCKLDTNRLEDENQRLREKLHGCKSRELADETADNVVRRLERFSVTHYPPTAAPAPAPAPARV